MHRQKDTTDRHIETKKRTGSERFRLIKEKRELDRDIGANTQAE